MRDKILNYVLYISILLLGMMHSYAQTHSLLGRVTDQQGKPIENSIVFIMKTDRQTTTNANGVFSITIEDGQHLYIQKDNYAIKKLEYSRHKSPIGQWDITLTSLKDTDIFYDNPQDDYALFIMDLASKNKKKNNLKKYSVDFYSKGNLQLASGRQTFLGQKRKDLDPTLDITDVNKYIYLGELSSQLTTLNEDLNKEKVLALNEIGKSKDLYFLTATDSDINLYNKVVSNQINIISPLMSYAKSYYYFKLLNKEKDSIGNDIYTIQFTPKRDREPIMEGKINITSDNWQITKLYAAINGENIDMKNVKQIVITQEYKYNPELNLYLKESQNLYLKGKFLVFDYIGSFKGYYQNYKLNSDISKSEFSNELIHYANNFLNQPHDYWIKNRPYPLTTREINTFNEQEVKLQETTKTTLDSLDKRTNNFTLFKLIKGYQHINTHKNSSITYRGLLSTFAFNAIQGFNVTTGLDYAKQKDDNSITKLGTIVNYGVSENKFRVSGYASHIFNQINYNTLTISGGSTILQFNQDDPVKTPINSIASAYFGKNYAKYFQKDYLQIKYEQYAFNKFKFTSILEYAHRSALNNSLQSPPFAPHKDFTSNNPLDPTDFSNAPFKDNSIFKLSLGMNIIFDQKIISYPDSKQYLPTSKYPIIKLNLDKTLNSTTNSYNYTFISFATQYNDNIGKIGNLYIGLSAGKYLEQNDIAFTDYKHFNGNQTFIGSTAVYNKHFNLLPYYEYSTNKSYVEFHLEHDFRGYIMNKIPLLNKTRYSLVIGYHVLNVPEKDVYGEYSIGLNNFGFGKFRPFRIDFFHSVSADAPKRFGFVFGIKVLDLIQK
ncbi:carboxypeptidase regulatory-like domain-containing protein [Myroides marinus]|uniref:CarboxypepD_reg-like domain-containing protein n=1 Tax=Myroides marinus TaxID=703342 RepID=A0A1H6W3H9_9FLAO|nr:DUF5686 family protein [Myroides marinus]MDM1349255.1 carboxypeptidase regulatory-like domain-containing protein [Myroides marinus]MDM1356465.1 carboxypeptidase regulatory-like domain-containing protein [Myroides marinus]MDM1363714.1 carboxypeptidase regulatory-like domain-containing protein [Myroides marinus]SEJ07370.1 hypothetical protein SAMN04488018_11134 [Myroides marinus]